MGGSAQLAAVLLLQLKGSIYAGSEGRRRDRNPAPLASSRLQPPLTTPSTSNYQLPVAFISLLELNQPMKTVSQKREERRSLVRGSSTVITSFALLVLLRR